MELLAGAGRADRNGWRPFLLPGALMSSPNSQALNSLGVSSLEYPSLYDDPERLAQLSLYIQEHSAADNLALPCVLRAESEGYGGEKDLPPFSSDGGAGSALPSEAVFEYPLKSVSDYKSLKSIRPETGKRATVVLDTLRILAKARPELPLVGDLVGPLSLATSLIDAGKLLRSFGSEQTQLFDFLDFLTDNSIAYMKLQQKAGARAFFLVDPFSSAEIIGPEFFARYAVPYINRVAKACAAEGTPLIVHICGEPELLLQELTGLKCAALSLHGLGGKGTGEALTEGRILAGGLSASALTLPGASAAPGAVTGSEEVACAVGYSIIAPSCSLDASVSLQSLRAAAEALIRAGRE